MEDVRLQRSGFRPACTCLRLLWYLSFGRFAGGVLPCGRSVPNRPGSLSTAGLHASARACGRAVAVWADLPGLDCGGAVPDRRSVSGPAQKYPRAHGGAACNRAHAGLLQCGLFQFYRYFYVRVLPVRAGGVADAAVPLGISGGRGVPGRIVGAVSELHGFGLRTGDDAVHPRRVGWPNGTTGPGRDRLQGRRHGLAGWCPLQSMHGSRFAPDGCGGLHCL